MLLIIYVTPRLLLNKKFHIRRFPTSIRIGKHLYKEENLNILIKFMGVFPPGTVVQLSNNMVGLVISVNASHLLFPNVLVYDPAVPRTQAPIIDLASKDIKIVNAIHPSKLPEKIKEYLNPRSRISYFFDSDE